MLSPSPPPGPENPMATSPIEDGARVKTRRSEIPVRTPERSGRASDAVMAVVQSLFQDGEVTMSVARLRAVLGEVCPDMGEAEAGAIILSLDADGDGAVHVDDVVKLFKAFQFQTVPSAAELAATPKQTGTPKQAGTPKPTASSADPGSSRASGSRLRPSEASSLAHKNKTLMETLEGMQAQLESAESELYTVTQRAAELESELAGSKDELADCKRLLSEYAMKYGEAEAAGEALREAAVRDAAELGRLAAAVSAGEEQLDAARLELAATRSALASQREAAAAAEDDAKHLREECARLKEALQAESVSRAARRRDSRKSLAARASLVARDLGVPLPAALRSPLAERDGNAQESVEGEEKRGSGLGGIAEGEEGVEEALQEQNEQLLAAHRALDERHKQADARATKLAERLQELEREVQLASIDRERDGREKASAEARLRQLEAEARALREKLEGEAAKKRAVEAGKAELEAQFRATRSQLKTRDDALKKATEERLKAAFVADRAKKEKERLEKERLEKEKAAAAKPAGRPGTAGRAGTSRALTVAKPWQTRPKTAAAVPTSAKERQEKALQAAMARLAILAQKKQESSKQKRWH